MFPGDWPYLGLGPSQGSPKLPKNLELPDGRFVEARAPDPASGPPASGPPASGPPVSFIHIICFWALPRPDRKTAATHAATT